MNDEYLRQITIGERKLHHAAITLVEYDPRWPELFAHEAERIREALAETIILLEHVGSTAVPGLCAKPVIDILLVLADSGDESSYVPALQSAGYILRIREPAWFEHRMFKGPDTDVNLHVFSIGAHEIERMLSFRDRLRSHPVDREDYANAKRALAGRVWRHVQDYADAKTTVIQDILARADADV